MLRPSCTRRRVLQSTGWLLAAMLPITHAGCKPPQATMIQYSVGRQNGSATVTFGSATVVLLGVPSRGPDVESMMKGSMMAGGSGSASGGSSADDINLKYQYRDGVLTINSGGAELEIIEAGKTLRVAGKTFPLDEKRTITLKPDGTIATEP